MALNILLVDDSTTVRAVIARSLELAGVPVGNLHQAANGREALAILGREWIDLVFADINMPVMNGVEMIEKMREDGLLQTIPVVICSTEGSVSRIEQLRAAGVRAYIRKPFTPELLRQVVEDTVGVPNDG
ncbi:MAG: response regulator [Candidatus Krumholzibacteriia bacterium]